MEGKLAKKPDVYDFDDVVAAIDDSGPVMFGLMTNHHLFIEGINGRFVIEGMADRMVTSAAAAINAASLNV